MSNQYTTETYMIPQQVGTVSIWQGVYLYRTLFWKDRPDLVYPCMEIFILKPGGPVI